VGVGVGERPGDLRELLGPRVAGGEQRLLLACERLVELPVDAVQLGEALLDGAQIGQQPFETGALTVEAEPYRLGLGALTGELLLFAPGQRGEERPEPALQPGDVGLLLAEPGLK